MVLSAEHRSTLVTGLAPVVGEEAAEALVHELPASSDQEPATVLQVREVAESTARVRELAEANAAQVRDLVGVTTRLEQQITVGLGEVRAEAAASEQVLRGEIAASQEVLRGEIAASQEVLRGEIAASQEVLRAEIAGSRDVLRGEIAALGQELRRGISGTRDVLRGEIIGSKEVLRAEVAASVATVRETLQAELGAVGDRFHGDLVRHTRWVAALLVTTVVSLVGTGLAAVSLLG